jgi:hypothetical protein
MFYSRRVDAIAKRERIAVSLLPVFQKGMPAGYAKVDRDIYLKARKWSWHVDTGGYARRCTHVGSMKDGTRKKITIKLHHMVVGPLEEGKEVDHKNRNRLDCRRENLRVVTKTQNQWNRSVGKRNKCRLKGVYPRGKKFAACVYHNKQRTYLGVFSTPEEAFAARMKTAGKEHKEFASA